MFGIPRPWPGVVQIDNTKLVNGNNEKISKGKYDCELWIRYKNTNEYILYDSFKNGSKGKKGNYYEVGQSVYNFGKNDGVVGFFILIYDMEESLYSIVDSYYKTSFLDVDINFIKQDIPESGTLYNFDYLQIYFRDENGNLVLQNEPELNSYNNYITKEDIANYDIETYNCYLQRDVATKKWVYYKRSLDYADLFIEKTTQGNIIQDSINQKFTGTFKLETQVQTTNVDMLYKEQYDGSDAINGFKIYDLLPEGMNLTSTTDEIIENITFSEYFGYTSELNKLTPEYMMEITDFKINIIENWRDTNRTKLEIIVNFSKPIYFTGANWKCPFIIYYDYEISYDSYLEYGCDYTNTCYIHQLDGYKGGYYKNYSSEQLGNSLPSCSPGNTINIPSNDFYLYWRTDGSQNNYYGFSIDKIEPVYLEESVSGTTVTLPNYTVIELTGNNYPETEHNPYKNNSNLLWHYVGIPQKTEETKYTLENTYSEELVPNIQIGTLIKAEEQNHIEMNNNKQYTFTEDTGDIVIEKNVTKEIVLKYIREQEYGSYVVKHEYYVKDFNNNLTLENTVSEEIVSNIPVDTVIKADEQNHIETNNEKQYTYTEDTGDITIQKDVTKEIIIKYIRDEEYTAELPETGSTDNIKNLIYVLFFLLLGSTSFFIATKKKY